MTAPVSTATDRRVDIALLVLRVVLGTIFLAHGAQKAFVFGQAGVTGAFTQMGIPLPVITGFLITLLELLGGVALIVGIFTRLAALGLAIDMLGAILLVRIKGGFFSPNGVEFELTLLASAVSVALTGPGAFALDTFVRQRRERS